MRNMASLVLLKVPACQRRLASYCVAQMARWPSFWTWSKHSGLAGVSLPSGSGTKGLARKEKERTVAARLRSDVSLACFVDGFALPHSELICQVLRDDEVLLVKALRVSRVPINGLNGTGKPSEPWRRLRRQAHG